MLSFQNGHLLKVFVMASNIHLEGAAFKLNIQFEGLQPCIELSGMKLCQTRSKESSLNLVDGHTDIVDLAKIVNVCFSRGL